MVRQTSPHTSHTYAALLSLVAFFSLAIGSQAIHPAFHVHPLEHPSSFYTYCDHGYIAYDQTQESQPIFSSPFAQSSHFCPLCAICIGCWCTAGETHPHCLCPQEAIISTFPYLAAMSFFQSLPCRSRGPPFSFLFLC